MIRQSDLLTKQAIRQIKDINQLNSLISKYESELTRRMEALQKYKAEEGLYAKGMNAFAMAAGKTGFKQSITFDTKAFEEAQVREAQNKLINLSSTLASGNTTIKGLRAKKRSSENKQRRGLVDAVNRKFGRRVLTYKRANEFTPEQWAEIRALLEENTSGIDSFEVIQIYVDERDSNTLTQLQDIINSKKSSNGIDSKAVSQL